MGDYINSGDLNKFPILTATESADPSVNPPEPKYDSMDTSNFSDYRRSTYPVPEKLTFTAAPFFLLRRKIPLRVGRKFAAVVQPVNANQLPNSSSSDAVQLPNSSIPDGQATDPIGPIDPTPQLAPDALTYITGGTLIDPDAYIDPQIAANTYYKGELYDDYETVNYGY